MAEIGDLLSDVVEASKITAKSRAVSIKPTVAKLTERIYENGVLPDDLSRLLDLITTPSLLDQASLASLIKNLYPIGRVSDENVLKVIGCLGHGKLKPSLAIQAHLLKWLILVYHLLESQTSLSQAYAVLFNLLDTAALRAELCHLLALITRRKHVRPFRIQAILSLSRNVGSDPRLVGLLRVYKNYYPEVIVGEATRGRAAPFKHPDPEWRTRLDEIQREHQQRTQSDDVEPRGGFKVNNPLHAQAAGKNKVVIPRVRTAHAQEDSVTLEEISSAEDFVQNLEKIELPNQLVAVLDDPLLQKLLLLRPGDDSQRRVNNWITDCVQEGAHQDPSVLATMLEPIHRYVTQTKTFDPVITEYFQRFLERWDGMDQRNLVLETISHVPLAEFQPLYESTFASLESKLLNHSPESQLSLLNFYSMLLRNWTTGILSNNTNPAAAGEAITQLAQHVSTLCLTLAQTSPTTTTHLAILTFYEHLSHLFSTSTPLRTGTLAPNPSPTLVFILHFGHSAVVLSRLCAVLATYKRVFESYTRHADTLTDAARDHINVFNGFLMDVCNCLWRGRALSATDENSVGCALPRELGLTLREYVKSVDGDLALGSAFGLTHSPVLCLQAVEHLRGLEDREEAGLDVEGVLPRHAGPVTSESLAKLAEDGGLELSWQNYRSGVLKHLEESGLGGAPELLYSAMKNLKNQRPG